MCVLLVHMGGQWTARGTWLSLYVMWFPGIQPRSSGSVASPLPDEHLTSPNAEFSFWVKPQKRSGSSQGDVSLSTGAHCVPMEMPIVLLWTFTCRGFIHKQP